jgi:hypothetical protein
VEKCCESDDKGGGRGVRGGELGETFEEVKVG